MNELTDIFKRTYKNDKMWSNTKNIFVSLNFRPSESQFNSIYGDQNYTKTFIVCVTRGPPCSVAEIICSFEHKYSFKGITDAKIVPLKISSDDVCNVQRN